jgi:sporulation protein YlmC with PRC-barrel domain
MKPIIATIGMVGLTALLAGPAFAQTTTGTTSTTTNTMAPNTGHPGNNAPNGSLEMYHGMWRASKLVGANVYNNDGTSIGTVDDLLIGKDGKISDAVVSVGGFLGIGGKLVSVPFDEFKFEESRGSTGAMTSGTTTPAVGTTTTTGMNNTTPATTTASNSERTVYFSIVLPNATKDSLNSAAGFKYEG